MNAAPVPEIDPFGDVSSPLLYVMRAATERALAELVDCGIEPARPAVLVGPPGIGKSLLLHVAGKSISGGGPRAFVSYPALDTEDLCCWILDELRSPRFEDPVFAFEAYLGHLRVIGSAFLLLVDDLHLMPTETLRWLGRLVVSSKGEFRFIGSAINDPHSDEKIASLGPTCQKVLIESPMQQDESSRYVHERLHLAGATEAIRALFDRTTVAELHRLSGGIPRALNAAAARLLQPNPTTRSDPERFRNWWHVPIR